MPFCSKCGSQLNTDASFCSDCGTPVEKTNNSNSSPSRNSDDVFQTQVKISSPQYGIINLENLPEGHIIGDRYVVREKVGQGGFGAVYRVFDRNMNIDKALKIIPEAIISDKEAMFDLQKEAQTMIALNHPNIVRVYDFHKTGEVKFIDMEYLDGKTLTEIKLEYANKLVPEEQVKEYAVKIAEGMAYAHDNGVLHKDIKPQNIKVTSKGIIKIMDFGIAETVRTSMSRLQNSSSSGTLVYMSPEQLRGKEVGKESDIYSFGAMLYELLSGNPPFYKGDINFQILNEIPEPMSFISSEFNQLIMKCLAKEYSKRQKDFKEVLNSLNIKAKEYVPVMKAETKSASHELFKQLVQVRIETIPENAAIEIDGRKKSESPFRDKLSIGNHSIKISKVGYKTIETNIEINERAENEFNVELETTIGTMLVDSDKPDMEIWVNGEKTDHKTPFTLNNVIPNKKYMLQVFGDELYSNPLEVSIQDFETKTVKLKTKEYPIIKEMVFVKGGSFQIGRYYKKSAQSVTIGSYYIRKYPITQKEWREIMGNNLSYFRDKRVTERGLLGIAIKKERIDLSDNPVENISWYDAIEFCNKLSIREGLTPVYSINNKSSPTNWRGGLIQADWQAHGYRLPTEAEWEYAARGGIKARGFIYSGSNNIGDVAWYYTNSNKGTHPVGSKRANELDIYDMSGNIWEWCWDWFGGYSSSAKTNPRGPNSGSYRVLRGGSWNRNANGCTVSFRNGSYATGTGGNIGFRISRNLP